MKKKSDKVKKFLAALKSTPDVSVNKLRQEFGLSAGYAYKLAQQSKAKVRNYKRLTERKPKMDSYIATADVAEVPVTFVLPVLPEQTNSVQVGGDHYKKNVIQPWDYISSNNLGYLEGNIIKYVTRWRDKNGREDLQKARHYLDKLLEVSAA